MRQNDRRGRAIVAGMLGLVASMMFGCGPSQEQAAMEQSQEAIGLQSLGEAYRTISLVNKRPPKRMQEVEQAAAASPSGLAGITASNVVVFWGAELTDLSEEPGKVPSDKILAYEKKVPEQGGYVLMLDRTVKKMTPEEFKAAPKAGKEPAARQGEALSRAGEDHADGLDVESGPDGRDRRGGDRRVDGGPRLGGRGAAPVPARVPRRLGRDGREHRLADATGTLHRRAAARGDPHPRRRLPDRSSTRSSSRSAPPPTPSTSRASSPGRRTSPARRGSGRNPTTTRSASGSTRPTGAGSSCTPGSTRTAPASTGRSTRSRPITSARPAPIS